MENQTQKTVVFLDNIGRSILADLEAEDEQSITVSNPAVLIVQPNPQTNQLQLQMLPLFFKEFLKDSNKSSWKFNKSSITSAVEIALADQLISQYKNMFQQQPQQEPEVVKLFDE